MVVKIIVMIVTFNTGETDELGKYRPCGESNPGHGGENDGS